MLLLEIFRAILKFFSRKTLVESDTPSVFDSQEHENDNKLPTYQNPPPPPPLKKPEATEIVGEEVEADKNLPKAAKKDLILQVVLHDETVNCSLSKLYVDGKFFCWVLEDGYRQIKVAGETRIPPGRYGVVRRHQGSFAQKYKARWGHLYGFEIVGVPDFKHILIHIGNDAQDTRGCLLVGERVDKNGTEFVLRESTQAYDRLYNLLRSAFEGGGRVFIEIERAQKIATA